MSNFGNRNTGFFAATGGGGGAPSSSIVILGSGAGSTVRCGENNTASGTYSTVFGLQNNAYTFGSFIGGGSFNTISGYYGCFSTISGGNNNTISAYYGKATISGGVYNFAGVSAVVSGGMFNTSSGGYSIVAGGRNNSSSGDFSTISGGYCNINSSGNNSTIGGGKLNIIVGCSSTISGGYKNCACNAENSTISGGKNNNICNGANGSAIIGGALNTSSGAYSVIGGVENTSIDRGSVVVGGRNNTSSTIYSVVSGGKNNTSSGIFSTISGGYKNIATGAIGFLIANTISGGYCNAVSEKFSTISGGYCNAASACYSSINGGLQALSYLYGQQANSSGKFAAQGDSQISNLVARKSVGLITGATSSLSLDGTGTTNLITPNGSNRLWNVISQWSAVVVGILGTATGIAIGDSITRNDNFFYKVVSGVGSISAVTPYGVNNDTSMVTANMTYANNSGSLQLSFVSATFGGAGTVNYRITARLQLTEVAW